MTSSEAKPPAYVTSPPAATTSAGPSALDQALLDAHHHFADALGPGEHRRHVANASTSRTSLTSIPSVSSFSIRSHPLRVVMQAVGDALEGVADRLEQLDQLLAFGVRRWAGKRVDEALGGPTRDDACSGSAKKFQPNWPSDPG